MTYAGEGVEQIECRGCRHWRPFVTQWGHCNCEMVRRHVDGEAPLVTRASFSCCFFSPAAATTRSSRELDLEEKLQAHAIAAAD